MTQACAFAGTFFSHQCAKNVLYVIAFMHSSPASVFVWKNGCDSVAAQKLLTESECRDYMNKNGLKAHNPFTGSWPKDCKKCIRSGSEVAYNTHSNPSCTTTWYTVCASEKLTGVGNGYRASHGAARSCSQ